MKSLKKIRFLIKIDMLGKDQYYWSLSVSGSEEKKVGAYISLFQTGICKTKKIAENDWLNFAKRNNIKNWVWDKRQRRRE